MEPATQRRHRNQKESFLFLSLSGNLPKTKAVVEESFPRCLQRTSSIHQHGRCAQQQYFHTGGNPSAKSTQTHTAQIQQRQYNVALDPVDFLETLPAPKLKSVTKPGSTWVLCVFVVLFWELGINGMRLVVGCSEPTQATRPRPTRGRGYGGGGPGWLRSHWLKMGLQNQNHNLLLSRSTKNSTTYYHRSAVPKDSKLNCYWAEALCPIVSSRHPSTSWHLSCGKQRPSQGKVLPPINSRNLTFGTRSP